MWQPKNSNVLQTKIVKKQTNTQVVIKLKNSNLIFFFLSKGDKNQELKLVQNSKNLNSNKPQILKLWKNANT